MKFRTQVIRFGLFFLLAPQLSISTVQAVDFEAFEFNEFNGAELFQAANSANPGNFWFTTNSGVDVLPSMMESGSYVVYKDTNAFVSSYLQMDNVSSGSVYIVADMSGWALRDFDSAEPEQVRFGFINEDTGDSGNTITAQMQFGRTDAGGFELTGSANGPGSSDIANSLDLAIDQNSGFTAVLELNKDANSYKLFYQDGAQPTQILGTGQVSPGRDANSVRFVMNNNWGSDFDFAREENFSIDRLAVSDTNPLTDLVTAEVNRDTGGLTLFNSTGEGLAGLERVSVSSESGALHADGWKPIAGNYDVNGDGSVDPNDPWMIEVSSRSLLAEAVQSGDGGSLAAGQQVVLNLDNEGVWIKGPYEDLQVDLVFVGGVTRTVDVSYVGNAGQGFVIGDLNFDNVLTADDWLLFVPFLEADLSSLSLAEAYQRGDLDGDGVNSVVDFGLFKSQYDLVNGSGAFEDMIASIPEPGSLLLTMMAALIPMTLRQNRRALLILVGLVIAPLFSHVTTAGIREDFPFNDVDGTFLEDAANVANPGNLWAEDVNDMTNSFVLDGSYLVQKDNANFASNGLDIEDVTSGTVWMVAEFDGWAFTGNVVSGDREEIRFTFLNNTTHSPPGSTITAQMEMERIDTDSGASPGRLEINGQALGTGTNISPVVIDLVQNDPFTMVLELNKDANQYSIFVRDGSNPFVPLGTGNVDPGRGGNTVRMVWNNDFQDGPGEFVSLDRFYITDESPLTGDVELLSIQVNDTTGLVTLANTTTNAFDIDYYRISSASGQLDASRWNSLDDQDYDATGSGVGQSWDEAGGSDDSVLAEAYLLGSSQFDPDETVDIGNIFRTASSGDMDLIFEYRDAASGNVFTGQIEVVTGGVNGDFNGDGNWDCVDVDELVMSIVAGENDPAFDMDGNGLVNGEDLAEWLIVGGMNNPEATSGQPFLPGDANLDGSVDGPDFLVWNTNKFSSLAAWCGGDFNADGNVDGADFLVWNTNKFTSADVSPVPEPAVCGIWAGLLLMIGRRMRIR